MGCGRTDVPQGGSSRSLKSEPSLPTLARYSPGAPLCGRETRRDRGLLRKQAVFLKRENVSRGQQRFSGALWEASLAGAPALQPRARPQLERPPSPCCSGSGEPTPARPEWRRLHGYTVPRIRLRPAPGQPGAGDQGLARWQAEDSGWTASQQSFRPPSSGKFNRA